MTPPVPRDVDDVAVDRACRGDRTVHLNGAEVAKAFGYLNARDYSAVAIAARLGVTERTVTRWRSGQTMPQGRPRTPGEQAC